MKKELTRQQYLDLYYYMRLNRTVEDTMVKLFRQNKIVGGLYSSLGQEAISVGTSYALEKKDWLAPMIRNIGALLVKGVPPRDIFMQHMAKYDSPTKGKDGTSHFGAVSRAEDRGHDVDWGRRKLDGRFSRRIEFRGDAEGAVCLDPGKQSVGVFDAGAEAGSTRESGGPCEGLWDRESHRGRQRRGGDVFDGEGGRRARSSGRRTYFD